MTMTTEGPLKTNFLENQARDISEPAYKKFPVVLLLVIFIVGAIVGIWQLVQFGLAYPKLAAAKNVTLQLQHPKMESGNAVVDMEVNNGNDLPLKGMTVKFSIFGPSGETVREGQLSVGCDVPASGKKVIEHLSLGALSQAAAKMHAEVTEATVGN
jgi:hypothetical protein